MVKKIKYKIRGRYLYPDVESIEIFENYSNALDELRRWKKEAKESTGLRFQGSIIKVKDDYDKRG